MSEESQENKKKKIYRIRPYYESYYDRDEQRLQYEYHLAGIPKENVKLKILPNMFSLEAKRTEEESEAIYSSSQCFINEIDVKSIEASFENGLLRFSAKLKDPLEKAYKITL